MSAGQGINQNKTLSKHDWRRRRGKESEREIAQRMF